MLGAAYISETRSRLAGLTTVYHFSPRKRNTFSWPVHPGACHVSNQAANPVDNGLHHTLRFILALHTANRFCAHCRQHVITRRQAHKQCKRHQPDTQAEVRRDHGKSRNVHLIVVRGSIVSSRLAVGKVSKPHIVIEQYQY